MVLSLIPVPRRCIRAQYCAKLRVLIYIGVLFFASMDNMMLSIQVTPSDKTYSTRRAGGKSDVVKYFIFKHYILYNQDGIGRKNPTLMLVCGPYASQ